MYELLDGEMGYGIRVGRSCVLDISTNREAVLALMQRMEQGGMDEEHVYAVIENWFGEQAYSEL